MIWAEKARAADSYSIAERPGCRSRGPTRLHGVKSFRERPEPLIPAARRSICARLSPGSGKSHPQEDNGSISCRQSSSPRLGQHRPRHGRYASSDGELPDTWQTRASSWSLRQARRRPDGGRADSAEDRRLRLRRGLGVRCCSNKGRDCRRVYVVGPASVGPSRLSLPRAPTTSTRWSRSPHPARPAAN